MTQTKWHFKEADSGGFVAFGRLRRQAREMTRRQFLDAFPVPAVLVVQQPEEDAIDEATDTATREGIQLLTAITESAAILRYLNRIAFLCKRPGNRFAHLISLGRSANNDITIAIDSVSKVHGYFSQDGDDWCFTDHNSTNGSRLNEHHLRASEKTVIKDEDQLQIGLEVAVEFFSPARLYDWLLT